MPDYFPLGSSSGFTRTPDSEIVTLYENGVSMSRIIRTVMWQDKLKKTSATHRVRTAIMLYHLGRNVCEPLPPRTPHPFAEPFPTHDFD